MATTTRTESRETRIIQHGRNLLAIFPNATERDPGTLCRKLRRLEAKAAAIALRLCNGPEFKTEDEADLICTGILRKVNQLLGNYADGDNYVPRTQTVPIFINRDPRGYALKIDDEWMRDNPNALHQDWGGYGLIAPEIK